MQFFVLGLMMVLSMATFTQPAFALEVDGVTADTTILDINNDTTNNQITLQFGETLAKTLLYSMTNNRFEFNDDVSITGSLSVSADLNVGSSLSVAEDLLVSSGAVDFSGASSFTTVTRSSDPSSCTAGMQFYNTTSNKLKVCTATNTWSVVSTDVDVNTFYANRVSSSANYTTLGEFIYSGTSVEGAISAVNATMHIAAGATSYSARIWDVTNSQVIAEVTGLTNTTAAIQSFGTISNLPSGQGLFQIQMKRVGGLLQTYTLGTVQVVH